MPVYAWSTTAAANATADATVNWAEGQAPSSVNDSARAMMAAVAKYTADISGAITSAGASSAYTVASNSAFDTLAHMHAQMIAFVPHATNTGSAGAQVTLNVDGLGAKPIRFAPGLEIPDGTLVAGTPYAVTYNNTDGAFYLQGLGSGNPYNIPLGGLLPYIGTAAPSTSFVLPFGQAISRGTYATLFTLAGTTFGAGDGSTTFNVPDLRGRGLFGKDNMGGSAAGRLSSTIAGTMLGATGGAESVTLAQSNLPNVQLAVTGTVAVSATGLVVAAGSAADTVAVGSGGGTIYQTAHFGTWTAASAALSGALTGYLSGGAASQTATSKLPPAMVVNWILRVI